MIRKSLVCIAFILACSVAQANDAAQAATVKKLAQDLCAWTIQGEYAKLIDHTYDGLVKAMGGREAAIETVKTLMGQMSDQGLKITSYSVGEPGKFYTSGKNTFVVIPTVMAMTMPGVRVNNKSYLLGISSDKGKSWKFADGAGLSDPTFLQSIFPKLPAALKLPEKESPEIIPEEEK
jgi:hypothetical protein